MAPRTGNYRYLATLQAPSGVVIDAKRGRVEVFATFGTWRVSIADKPFVKDEQDNAVLHLIEGLWRQDIWDRWYGTGKSVRLVVNGMTLKVLALVNPQGLSRVLQVHAAKVVES